MRSLASWGSRPVKTMQNDISIHAHLEGGIGIEYDEVTKAIKVAVCYRSVNDPNKFTKAESYRRLNTRLDVARPSTLLWQGTWEGDPSKVKTELFAALTKFAKVSMFLSCASVRYGPKSIHMTREGAFVTSLNGMIISWLIKHPSVTGSFKFTQMPVLPLDAQDLEEKDPFVQMYFDSQYMFVEEVQDQVDKIIKGEIAVDKNGDLNKDVKSQ